MQLGTYFHEILLPIAHRLVTASAQGDLTIFKLFKDKLVCDVEGNTAQHEGRVTAIDVWQKRKLLLSAGFDHKVKLWNFRKQLLYQLQVGDPVHVAVFGTQQHDIILSMNGSIYRLHRREFEKDLAASEHDRNEENEQ